MAFVNSAWHHPHADLVMDTLQELIPFRDTAQIDLACPICGPARHSDYNRHRKVLRVFPNGDGSAGYFCIRCRATGYIPNREWKNPGYFVSSTAQFGTECRSVEKPRNPDARVARARYLYGMSQAIEGTIAETYLREARGTGIEIPPTLRFLPANNAYPPAMLGVFGLFDEVEPGLLEVVEDRIAAVHLTRLKPDGSGHVGDGAKTMHGVVKGTPLMLSPPNDNLGLLICEGIETGLSHLQMAGLGVWVAGSISFYPALAGAIPDYIECVSIDDEGGDATKDSIAQLCADISSREMEVIVLKNG